MARASGPSNNAGIALFLQDLAGGGAERIMLRLAGGLADQGARVDLVLVREEGPYMSEIPANVRLVALGSGRTARSVLPLARYLRRERPGALLSALVHVNIVAILAGRLARCGTRVVVTEHNTISKNAPAGANRGAKWGPRLVRWVYPFADRIVAVSNGVADDLSAFGGLDRGRIEVAYNPVVSPDLPGQAAAPPEHPWFAASQTPLLLGVGRLTPQKDFANLLRAFSLVRARRPARLVILGEGPERPALEALVRQLGLEDCVDLPGFLKNPYSLMARADAFVLSSAWEGLPTVLVEALACGTAVVATDCPSGPEEILEGGRYGRLVPVGDPDGLAQAIAETLEDPLPAEQLRARAADFSVEASVSRYRSLLSGTP